jgi:intein/homing endonuclease
MGELRVGDIIFNEQGQPVNVLEVFDVMNDRPCFKVKFSDGSEIIADADHEWVVNSRNRRDKSKKTVTTQDLLGTSIDVAKPLAIDDKDYGILSPYLLGYWLGDGHSAGAMLTIGDEDYKNVEEILDSEGYSLDKLKGNILYALRLKGVHDVWTELPVLDDPEFKPRVDSLSSGDVRSIRIRVKNGEELRDLAKEFGLYPSSITQFIRGEYRASAGGPIRGDLVGFELNRMLKKLNLHNNKHVPTSYMRGSEAQRLSLLQGLMDSDGHCCKSGRCEITFKSELLARSVFELAASLGQKPFIGSKRARCNGVDAGIVWRVGFKPLDIQPFKIKRKADRVKEVSPLSRTKLTHRIVESVDPVPSVPVRCIRVSGPSSLFLVGETMIPTHNSKSIQLRAYAFPFLYPKQEMVVTAPELNHLQPITGIIEELFTSTRLAQEMLLKNRSRISHRPFIMNFANGARILGKIPQRDGRGIKGTHPIWLEQDEAQDYPHAGWTEIIETLRQGMTGASWRAHGVTRGVQDDFYKRSADPKTEWTVHRIYAMHSPEWSDTVRRKKIAEYGSRDDPDYRRNVLGEHGDATNPLFVLHRLMRCQLRDTPILTLDGDITTPIQDVEIGSKVANAVGYGTVLNNIESKHDTICKVVVDGNELYCTPDHPIFTQRGWVQAGELRPGDQLFSPEDVRELWVDDSGEESSEAFLRQKLYEEVW